jgi:hypothetical protein
MTATSGWSCGWVTVIVTLSVAEVPIQNSPIAENVV